MTLFTDLSVSSESLAFDLSIFLFHLNPTFCKHMPVEGVAIFVQECTINCLVLAINLFNSLRTYVYHSEVKPEKI